MSTVHVAAVLCAIGYLILAWAVYRLLFGKPKLKALRHVPVIPIDRREMHTPYPMHKRNLNQY